MPDRPRAFVAATADWFGRLRRAAAARRPALIGTVVFAAVALRLAWLADDGAITARVIANTLAGYGPNYNITERAQAFTHPSWFLLNTVAARLTGDIAITMLVVGVVCAAAALYLVLARRHWVVAVIVTALGASTYALTEYAGSGLENPLSWLLMAAMWRAAVARRSVVMAVAAGLLVVTRLDLALVAVPFVAVWTLRAPLSRTAQLRVAGLAALPPILWLSFSWLYYGSPLPETAYSKLNIAIPQRELLGQGVRYLIDLTRHDVLAAVVIVFALGLLATGRLRRESMLLVATGVGLYGCYVVVIGGDFMSGRFWTVPVFAALVAIGDGAEELAGAQHETFPLSPPAAVAALSALVLPVLLAPAVGLPMFRDVFNPQARTVSDLQANDGIADEWTFYVDRARSQGLMQWITQDPYNSGLEQMRAAADAWKPGQVATRIDVRCGEVGRHALISGPSVHWVVPCALSDPLLARIEFEAQEQNWRVGHYDRPIPPGYFDALATGSPDPLPPEIQELFRTVSLPRRIPERWAAEVGYP